MSRLVGKVAVITAGAGEIGLCSSWPVTTAASATAASAWSTAAIQQPEEVRTTREATALFLVCRQSREKQSKTGIAICRIN
jgi:hypothetical protein